MGENPLTSVEDGLKERQAAHPFTISPCNMQRLASERHRRLPARRLFVRLGDLRLYRDPLLLCLPLLLETGEVRQFCFLHPQYAPPPLAAIVLQVKVPRKHTWRNRYPVEPVHESLQMHDNYCLYWNLYTQ